MFEYTVNWLHFMGLFLPSSKCQWFCYLLHIKMQGKKKLLGMISVMLILLGSQILWSMESLDSCLLLLFIKSVVVELLVGQAADTVGGHAE